MQKTFLKRYCIKLQHTNDPDLLALRFDGKIFYVALQSAHASGKGEAKHQDKLLCKLLWMGLKNNENSARRYF